MAHKYRADQVGSFLRPQAVREAHTAYGEGKISLEDLRKVEDEHILKLLDAGVGNHLLLSHDRGWYDPAAPGRDVKPYTHLCEVLLPKLLAHGVDEATIHQLTHTNPFRAFARN